ncbi:MAG: phosphoribosylformylglycinamidine cyclo-ligase [Deltaproteobacteria bacterium]|nr:phosphoribosylformylglycinamidine cyclo-ligase [Deltaproteobacteria bacterium]
MSQHYARAGVDLGAADEFIARIAPHARSTTRPEVLAGVGGFAAHLALDLARYRAPIIVTSTDGVGTKLRVAIETATLDTIGIDLVAMCANDIACSGAAPLAFLDYFATGKLAPTYHAPIIAGIANACRTIGCALVGGETAELPGMYTGTDFDLAGFVIGLVDRDRLIDGHTIQPGQVVVGIAATGFHSNGYSLLRRVLLEEQRLQLTDRFPEMPASVGEVLLTPTALYSPLVAQLMTAGRIHGIAHITGGGLTGNIPRILPATCQMRFHWSRWTLPTPFAVVQRMAGLSDAELRTVLNCGIGLVVIVDAAFATTACETATAAGFAAHAIGEIVARPSNAEPIVYV